MIHIHPFPARMAPDIALNGLQHLPSDYVVLDPMSGSGMVLGTAAKLGLKAIGYDLDPLACLISRTNGRSVNEGRVRKALDTLLLRCRQTDGSDVVLPWIDFDDETGRYVDFWFGPAQQAQLRAISHHLVSVPFCSSQPVLDILKIAVSRLIVTKEPKASLARDTAHSRPHRTITSNDFDILEALPQSLQHVLSALQPEKVITDVKAYRGDARRMGRIKDSSVDCIVTSPPYLNAIDYMRGHRLSLVWFGYDLKKLRRIRARSVGAEAFHERRAGEEFGKFLAQIHDDVGEKPRRILERYYFDICDLTDEAFRVLRNERSATYVVGNSNIKGHEISNADILEMAAKRSGLKLTEKYVRDIPENRRYMPLANSKDSNLSKRMRSEFVMIFQKVA